MKQSALEKTLGNFTGSEGSHPFGPDALVFKVMGKMFALVSQNEAPPRVTLKCAPADAEILVGEYESIVPGYYMNKCHWITISLVDEILAQLLLELVNGSYDLVVSKLTRAEKLKLGEGCGSVRRDQD